MKSGILGYTWALGYTKKFALLFGFQITQKYHMDIKLHSESLFFKHGTQTVPLKQNKTMNAHDINAREKENRYEFR